MRAQAQVRWVRRPRRFLTALVPGAFRRVAPVPVAGKTLLRLLESRRLKENDSEIDRRRQGAAAVAAPGCGGRC